jgi:hypothetical protein
MRRTKSTANQTSNHASKTRATRGHGVRREPSTDETTKIRRYVDFVRAVVGGTRNGR